MSIPLFSVVISMKFFHTLRQDLNKTVLNIGFVGAMLMTCLLAFTGSAYRDESNDKSYSILEAFFSFDRRFIESREDFSSFRLFGICVRFMFPAFSSYDIDPEMKRMMFTLSEGQVVLNTSFSASAS